MKRTINSYSVVAGEVNIQENHPFTVSTLQTLFGDEELVISTFNDGFKVEPKNKPDKDGGIYTFNAGEWK